MIPPEPTTTWQLPTRHIGRRVLVFDRLDSTSTYAGGLGHDPANDGVVVLADAQSAGRGQHGRSWACPPGEGVLLSVLLYPPPELRRPALLTAWAAVGVCATIRAAAGLQATIKWPNDVLLGGRKVCGILSEMRNAAGGWHAVVGIGLNVRQSAETFARAVLPDATSLACAAGRHLERDAVARVLIQHLDAVYGQLRDGAYAALEAEWQAGLGLLGRPVRAECLAGTQHGLLRELTWDGLILEQPDGTVVRLAPESVRHLFAG